MLKNILILDLEISVSIYTISYNKNELPKCSIGAKHYQDVFQRYNIIPNHNMHITKWESNMIEEYDRENCA